MYHSDLIRDSDPLEMAWMVYSYSLQLTNDHVYVCARRLCVLDLSLLLYFLTAVNHTILKDRHIIRLFHVFYLVYVNQMCQMKECTSSTD